MPYKWRRRKRNPANPFINAIKPKTKPECQMITQKKIDEQFGGQSAFQKLWGDWVLIHHCTYNKFSLLNVFLSPFYLMFLLFFKTLLKIVSQTENGKKLSKLFTDTRSRDIYYVCRWGHGRGLCGFPMSPGIFMRAHLNTARPVKLVTLKDVRTHKDVMLLDKYNCTSTLIHVMHTCF